MKQDSKELILKDFPDFFRLKNTATFATVAKDGVPNIVPIHSKHLIGKNRILITDQFMKKTKENVQKTGLCSLGFKCGPYFYTITGTAIYRSSGFLYMIAVRKASKYAKKNDSKGKNINLRCKGIIIMNDCKLQRELTEE